MLSDSIKMQLKVIYEKKVAMIVLFLLFAVVFINYFENVFLYSGTDILDMYHPMKLLTLSTWSGSSYYILQYFPLIVAIPAGFSLFSDQVSNQYIYIQSRVGARNYYLGKLIVVFSVTFFVFTIPFLTEIILNLIAFPISATGDPSNSSIYRLYETTKQYLFSDLYIRSTYLYAIVFTMIFGLFSGVLAVFTTAISTFPIKFKVLLFLPVYLLLYLTSMLKQLIPTIPIETNYFFYLRIFGIHRNSTGGFIALISFMLIFLILSVLIIMSKSRKDAL